MQASMVRTRSWHWHVYWGVQAVTCYSCRDGLTKPPPMTKKRIEALIAGNNDPPPAHSARNDIEPNHKEASQSLRRLEALHERTGVEKSLRLGEGGRIKLQSELAPRSQSSRKPVPQFDIEFTKLKHEPSATVTTPMELSDSDDDLPDPGSYLRKHSKSRPAEQAVSSDSTNYSNSEFDALIANASISDELHLDERRAAPGNSRAAGAAYSSPYRMDWDTTTSSRKRKQTEHDTSPQKKRHRHTLEDPFGRKVRLAHLVSCIFSQLKTRQASLSPMLSGRQQEALFDLSPGASEGPLLSRSPGRSSPATSPNPGLVYDEGFTLDTSLFEIVPSTPPLADFVDEEVAEPRGRMYRTNALSVDASRQGEPKGEDPHKLSSMQPEVEEHDPLAELEAWLQSGAVEIGEE